MKNFHDLYGITELNDKGNSGMYRIPEINKSFVRFLLYHFLLLVIGLSSVSNMFAQSAIRVDTVMIKKLSDSTYLHSIPFDSAVKYLEQALTLAEKTGKGFMIAKTYKNEGEFYYDCGHYQDALSNYHQAENIYKRNKFDRDYLKVLINICDCFRYLSQPDSLLIYARKGLSLVKKTNNNQPLLARFIDEMGAYYELKEDYSSALTYYLKALKIDQKINNPDGIAREKINIGIIYDGFDDTVNAIRFYKEALEIGRRYKMEDVVSACLSNLSTLKNDKDTPENDNRDELISIALDKKSGDNYGIAIGYNNIGVSKNDRGQYTAAKENYLKSYALSKRYGFQDLELLVLYNLGYFFLDSTHFHNTDSTIYYLLKAKKLSKKLNKNKDLDDILYLLQSTYEQRKEYKKAHQTAMAYERLDKMVYTQEKDKKISEVMAKYESEQKENKILESKSKLQVILLMGIIIFLSLLLIISLLLITWRLHRLKSKKLVQQKQFAESLLGHASSYVMVLSKSFRTVFVNSVFQLDFGYDVEKMPPEILYEKLHPEDRIALKKQWNIVQKENMQKAIFECRIKNVKGIYRTISGVLSNKLHNKILNGYLINFWDITDLKEEERLLEVREKNYRHIFEAFPDIYFRQNVVGTITEVTPSVEMISGYQPEDVLGRKVTAFFQNKTEHRIIGKEIVEKGEIHDHTITLIKKDGMPVITSLNAKTLFDDSGRINGLSGVLRDMTGREKRTQQLQEANTTKDKLFSIIAHDLIGPIGTQKNLIDLILLDIDQMPKEEIISLFMSMKPSLDATYFMIENLLSWARIMQKSIEPQITGNNIYTLVEQIFEFLQVQADKKNIQLLFHGDRKIKAFFDKNLLSVVLRNLIANAMKFSPEGSAVIVDAERKGEKVKIAIIDKGIGIPPDILKNLNAEKHKSYSRLGTKNEKGTGIGLIIVKEFIHKNKSHLTIESQVGKGSVFSFELPSA